MKKILLTILICGALQMESFANELPDFNKLWNFRNPSETEQKFREILPKAEKSGDKDYYLQLLTQLARTQSLQRKFTEAHEILDKVEKEKNEDLKLVTVRYLLERGRTFNSNGEKDKAKPLFVEAYEIANENKFGNFALDAAHMVAIVEPLENQNEWQFKALEIALKSNDPKVSSWQGPLYNNIGMTFLDLKDYSNALKYFEKGLEWRISQKDEYGTRVAKWTVARAKRGLGEIDSAIKIQFEIKNEIEEKELDPDGYVFEELGECFLLKNENQKAENYFKQAYELLSKDEWLKANDPKKLERLKTLGKIE